MTTGAKSGPATSRRRFLLAMTVLGVTGLGSVHAQEWTLDMLMSRLASVHSTRARFVEKRYLAVLKKPIESMGVLIYQAPGHLEKIVHKPKSERVLLEGDQITLEADGGRRRKVVPLSDIPELAPLVGGLRATLAGDATALARYFTLTLEGPLEHWRLLLTPLDKKSARLIKFIRIFGTDADLTSVEVMQADGDRSLMLMVKDSE